jgi:hypothetical protein
VRGRAEACVTNDTQLHKLRLAASLLALPLGILFNTPTGRPARALASYVARSPVVSA